MTVETFSQPKKTMGKTKAKGGGKGGKAAAAPKCTCTHLYECSCGNRPERPSRGHRWDGETQQWGGKGHKQKGASGQISSKSAEATTTAVGKTTVAQWQRLPTQLLDEVTKREGRPRPKYKSIGSYKYRVIVQDAKVARRGTDHDLILVPREACGNDEQARQEAALLALLHLTPSIPHERKLPEPYKTTWLHAVKAAKETTKNKPAGRVPDNNRKPEAQGQGSNGEGTTGVRTGGVRTGGAKVSTGLAMGNTFVSRADKRRQQDQKRQERNRRIQKHEAVRVANRDHQVFLSAQMRKRIETLLRGDPIQWDEKDDDDNDEDEDDDDLKAYVVERLHTEGFTRSQAKKSFSEVQSGVLSAPSEEQWDGVYDECLQWLCIHLDEDQLPEGFDPRGRTLDVIVAGEKSTKQTDVPPAIQHLSSTYGITIPEASSLSKRVDSGEGAVDFLLWKALCSKAATALTTQSENVDHAQCMELAGDELEALQAIFPPEECQVNRQEGTTTVKISLSSSDDKQKLELCITTRDGIYPAVHVDRILICGKWSKPHHGVAVHIKLIQFLSELPLEDPMMYELFGKAQELLQEAEDGELKPVTLASSAEKAPTQAKPKAQQVQGKAPSNARPARKRRPRQRSPFWSLPPRKTPKATAFPELDANIRRQRGSLPAAKARQDFLQAMKKSEESGRVVLVTGDTGCGKTTQIPQFILEEAPDYAKIVVAQPRRLAATGVAARVANERGESQPGSGSVGYVVRGDVAMCNNTRLMFCTTGVLLRQLQSEGALDSVTHIIVGKFTSIFLWG